MLSFATTFESRAEAEAYVVRFLNQFPPQGYGSFGTVTEMVDGRFHVVCSRYASCD